MPDNNQKLVIVGIGNMGTALLRGILKADLLPASNITVTSRNADRRDAIANELGVSATDDNASTVGEADIVLLCIKPQGINDIAEQIRTGCSPETLVISILAGITTEHMAELFGDTTPTVRAMPNIPSMVDCGATAIVAGPCATRQHMELASAVFDAVGEVVEVAEGQMDAVTGLSGSGPAYIYMIIEALTDGGVKMGLPREIALKLATQTVMGSARLVKETGIHPAVLRDQVTTPGGTAIAAIHDLESHGLRTMLISAVVTATKRSQTLNG